METVQFKMNMPLDVKQWIEGEARQTNRSQSAMVVTILRAAMPLGAAFLDAGEVEDDH